MLVLDRTSDLAARIRHNAVPGGAVVKACPDVARAEDHLARGAWDVIVAGPSVMHRGGLRRLASLHQRYPWVAIVLALHERPRADLAEIIQVGASDLVPLHAGDDELRQALGRATRLARATLGVLTNERGAGPRGRIVMSASASGGCGKTFLATNTAEHLARITGQPVVLLDLDLQFGEVSTALRLRPDVTIADALAAEAEGHDLDAILDDHLLAHPDGFEVLAAPRRPAEADSITPGDVTRILDVLRARGAWVVIDTHAGLSDVFVAALDVTDHLFVVATPDRPSLVNLGRYLGALERLGMQAANISVVLNKAWEPHLPPPPHGPDALDMAAELGRRFDAIVPYSLDVSRSINVGVPLIVGRPKSPVARQLTAAIEAVLPGRRPVVQPQPAPSPVATRPVPVPVPVESTPAITDPPEDDTLEIDLSEPSEPAEPRPRPCPRTVRARPVSRCRRPADEPIRGPCRSRDPPRRRGESASSPMRTPPAVPRVWPDSSPALVPPPPPNDPQGL